MQSESEKSIFDPIKRSSVKTFTSSNKPLKLKVHDKVIELKENCNLFARCATVKDKRNIDMRTVIGEHELTNVPLSLFNPDGSLINGGVGKSSAVDEVLKFANAKSLTQVRHDFPVCYVIDGMSILNKLNPKPPWVKQGVDLAAAFNMSIDTHTHDATAVIVTFHCYRDIFHSNKQPERLGKVKGLRVHFIYPTRVILTK